MSSKRYKMRLNGIETNDITQFSDLREIALALIGKYLKYKSNNYCISLRGNMCFIHAWGDCIIDLPDHYDFRFTDAKGEHLIKKGENQIAVTGYCQAFFTIKG